MQDAKFVSSLQKAVAMYTHRRRRAPMEPTSAEVAQKQSNCLLPRLPARHRSAHLGWGLPQG